VATINAAQPAGRRFSMLAAMARALALNEHAVWWPSTLYQTTTLDLRGAGTRVLVDPGISPWEI